MHGERERERGEHCRTFITALHWRSTESSLLGPLSYHYRWGGRGGRRGPTHWYKKRQPTHQSDRKYCTVTGFPDKCWSMHLDHGLEIGNVFPRRSETAVQSTFKTLRVEGAGERWSSLLLIQQSTPPCTPVWCTEGICCSLCDVGVAAQPNKRMLLLTFARTEENIWNWREENTSKCAILDWSVRIKMHKLMLFCFFYDDHLV